MGYRVSVGSTDMGDIRSARGKHLVLEGDITDEGEEAFHPRAPAGRSQRLGTVPPFRDQPEDGTHVQAAFEEIFDEFGLPNAIHGQRALLCLSQAALE